MIQAKRFENLAAEVVTSNFAIVSGVSSESGGNNEGPSPHELLEGALAACTIITVQMYANRKGIKLKNTHVEVNTQSETRERSVISRTIRFEGELSQEERTRLAEIANKCPIHKLLSSHIAIETKVADE